MHDDHGDGVAVFEATPGMAPGFAGTERVSPGSLILSTEMMLRRIGWHEAADLIMRSVAGTIANEELTFDLARLRAAIRHPRARGARPPVEEGLECLVPRGRLVGTTGFGAAVIRDTKEAY